MKAKSVRARQAVLLGASLQALAVAQPAVAQTCPGTAAAPCEINVTTPGQTVQTQGATHIVNSTTGTTIVQTASGYLLVENQAGASISGLTLGAPAVAQPQFYQFVNVPRSGINIINAGTIEGDVLFTSGIYVNAGGTVTGNVAALNLSSTTSETFINRGGANLGVAGTIDPGRGLDIFIQSYSASGTYDTAAPLPTNFEVGGVEALGADTVVTVTNSAGGATEGLLLRGNGHVVNRARIDNLSLVATGAPAFVLPLLTVRAISYSGPPGDNSAVNFAYPILGSAIQITLTDTLPYGSALESFTNESEINGDLLLSTAAFTNSGDINLQSNESGTVILAASNRDFSFVNRGDIVMTDTGGRISPLLRSAISIGSAIDATTPANVSLLNDSGATISGGLAFQGIASHFSFENKGTIAIGANPNGVDRAVEFEIGNTLFSLDENARELPVDSAIIVNSGTLDGGIDASVFGRTFSFTNSGTITRDPEDSEAEAVGLEMNDDVEIDGESFAFVNSGTIGGTTEIDLNTTNAAITNSGTITREKTPGTTLFPARMGGLTISQETNVDSTLTLTNSGTIETADQGAGALLIGVEAGDLESGAPGAANANAVVNIVNSGTIRTTGNIFLTPGEYFGVDQNAFVVQVPVALGVALDAEGQSTLAITNQAGGEILSEIAPIIYGTPFGAITLEGDGAPGNAIVAIADHVTITNDGLIRNRAGGGGFLTPPPPGGSPTLTFYPGYGFVSAEQQEGVFGGAIDTYFSADTVTNGATGEILGGIALRQGDDMLINLGHIEGNVLMGSGNDHLINRGTLIGNVSLGDGDDVLETLLADREAHLSGEVDGGAGNDTLVLLADAGGSLALFANPIPDGFEAKVLGGTGTVTSGGDTPLDTIHLVASDITLAAGSTVTATGAIAFTGDEDAQTFTNRGTITGGITLGGGNDRLANYGTLDGDVDLGDGDDSFTLGINAAFTGTADGGAGSDAFILDITGGGTIAQGLYDRLINFETLSLTGSGTIISDAPLPVDTVQLTGDAPVEFGATAVIQTQGDTAVTGSDGGDALTNKGTIIGNVALGAGADAFTNEGMTTGNVDTGDGDDMLANSGTVTGNVVTGAGSDMLTNSGTIDGDVALDGGEAAPPPPPQTELLLTRAFAVAQEAPTDGDDVFTSTGAITGSVSAGGGNDVFTLSNSVGGDVDMGSGDDTLVLLGAWSIAGSATGGDGTDVVRATFSGTATAPQELDLSGYEAFEELDVVGGTGAYSGAASFPTVHVDGGRLIGRAGSVLTGNVTVASGATFGSAGTVNGSVIVNGTLSPGASPGTMTVNGNVALNAGSNSLFEFTPAVSDALVINGTLTIASGASLTMTGQRPLTPGTYNLVTASGGITGSFGANVTRDSTVLGVLNYTANAIQLLSTFQLGAGATAQVTRTNTYLNALLINGQATAGILAAFPNLVGADGFANQAVLSTLSPEAYASAVQMGIENGLTITSALRSVRIAGLHEEGGLFVFGQGYAGKRDFDADSRGVSSADITGSGFLGGVGFGNDSLGASVFVGRSDSRQRIRGIGARNDADGLFFGGRLHHAAGGLSLGATLLFDRASADTDRTLGTGGTARSHYRLRGTTIDAYAGYGFTVGEGWQIGPQIGLTHVSVKRGGVSESGGGAFALDVAGKSYDATFVTGDLRLGAAPDMQFRPWVSGGVRYRAGGDAITATGAFTGTPTAYTVDGARRDRTLWHAAAGMDVDVTTNVALFVNGDVEFSGSNGSRSASGGIRIRF